MTFTRVESILRQTSLNGETFSKTATLKYKLLCRHDYLATLCDMLANGPDSIKIFAIRVGPRMNIDSIEGNLPSSDFLPLPIFRNLTAKFFTTSKIEDVEFNEIVKYEFKQITLNGYRVDQPKVRFRGVFELFNYEWRLRSLEYF